MGTLGFGGLEKKEERGESNVPDNCDLQVFVHLLKDRIPKMYFVTSMTLTPHNLNVNYGIPWLRLGSLIFIKHQEFSPVIIKMVANKCHLVCLWNNYQI